MPTPTQEYRMIPLTQGQVAIVDSVDFEQINQHKWYAAWMPLARSFYAVRGITLPEGKRTIWMHRELLGLDFGDPRTGDHRNHDTLDNRRSKNLRIASHAENVRNKRIYACNTTGFKGVSRHRFKYQAHIRLDGKLIHLGTCDTPESAYSLYCEAALRLHGEFASLK